MELLDKFFADTLKGYMIKETPETKALSEKALCLYEKILSFLGEPEQKMLFDLDKIHYEISDAYADIGFSDGYKAGFKSAVRLIFEVLN